MLVAAGIANFSGASWVPIDRPDERVFASACAWRGRGGGGSFVTEQPLPSAVIDESSVSTPSVGGVTSMRQAKRVCVGHGDAIVRSSGFANNPLCSTEARCA